MSDSKVFTQNMINLAMLAFTGFLFWYLIQSKELIRFFDIQATIRRQKQVSNILDSQSDGIVVISLNKALSPD